MDKDKLEEIIGGMIGLRACMRAMIDALPFHTETQKETFLRSAERSAHSHASGFMIPDSDVDSQRVKDHYSLIIETMFDPNAREYFTALGHVRSVGSAQVPQG